MCGGMHESIVFCSTFAMSSYRKFTFAISSPDEFLVYNLIKLVTCSNHGQYWAGRTPPPNNCPPNMAAANFVVLANGEGCTLNGTAVAAVLIDQ